MKKISLLFFAALLSMAIISCEKKTDQQGTETADKNETVEMHNFTAEDLMTVKRQSDPQLSPDGKHLLYRMGTPNIEENKISNDIYVISLEDKKITQITTDEASEFNARWSPDGKQIAYISTKGDAPQIYVMDFPNGKAKQITKAENGAENMAWSPDGTMFSFTSDVKMHSTVAEKYPQFPKAKVRMYDKIPIRAWDVWEDENRSHLFVIPSKGGEAKDLTADEPHDTPMKPFGGGEQIVWSPDSKELIYTAKKGPKFAENTNSALYLVSVDGGEAIDLTPELLGYDMNPLYSPDGKWLAFNSMEHDGFESDRHRLMLMNRETKEITELSKTLDQWVGQTVWAADSKSLYFCAEDSGSVHPHQIMVEDGSWKTLAEDAYNYGSGLAASADGTFLIIGRQSMIEPLDFYKMNLADNSVEQITNANEDLMKNINKVKTEERWITSTDGKQVMCWIVYPPNFDPNKKYPMITYCQGGPQSMIGQRFHYRWNYFLMASNDYVVLLPNRRGLPGFGQKWNNAISGDWGGMPMQDILAATDEIAKESYVDNDGLCALGASAGGYAAFWLAGNHEGRFKAFISHCGVFNMESMYGSTEELFFPNWENGGPYWEEKNKKFYEEHSAHKFADKWDTPILISTGENDFRVPYTQSLEAFTVAQVKGIDSKILIFPEETHFIAHAQEFIIWSSEFFEFLDKYTKK